MVILTQKIKLLKGSYDPPNPMQSYEAYLKHCNLDLADLDDLDLWREEARAKMNLLHCDPDKLFMNIQGEILSVQSWFLSRIVAIRKEKRRRQYER